MLEILEPYSNHSQKNYLVPIQILLTPKDGVHSELYNKYVAKIKELRLKIDGNYDENTKSKRQGDNWIEYSEVLKLLSKLKKKAKPIMERSTEDWKYLLSEMEIVQQYLLWYLYSGKAFPPVRNDFANMKISKDGEYTNEGNWLVMSKIPMFVLNEYKTANKIKNRGDDPQVKIYVKDMALRKLLQFWVDKMNKTQYLLLNINSIATDDYKMTENGITKNLTKISMKYLDKKISSSLLRSIYITDKQKDLKTMKDKKDLA